MPSREDSGASRRETPRRSTARHRLGFKPGHCDRSARCDGHPAWCQPGRGVRGPMAPNWTGAGWRTVIAPLFPTSGLTPLIEDGSLWAAGRGAGSAGRRGTVAMLARSSLRWACCRQGERGPVPSVGRLSGSPRCPCPSLPCSGPRGAFHPVNALRLWLLAIAVAPFWSESCYVRDAAPT
jgi:hypothetical protein